jgi:hypothetical protein
MPIVGNLSEFPLPEVLLLVGQRTGRLRLLDVPAFGVLDLDISEGAVQTMHIGVSIITETQKMLDNLGAIVEAQTGMFEFKLVPISVIAHQPTLTIHDLAMQLVCHVGERAARQLMVPSSEQGYQLVLPQPNIWVEPELNQFFLAAHRLLTAGVNVDELARGLQMEPKLVRKSLTHLRLLGLIKAIDCETSVGVGQKEPKRRDGLAQKTSAFIHVARMTDRIRKLSSKLPAA